MNDAVLLTDMNELHMMQSCRALGNLEGCTLPVDTCDVPRVVRLRTGGGGRIGAVRLDSGDPVAQARLARHARCRRLRRSPGLLRLSAETDRAPS